MRKAPENDDRDLLPEYDFSKGIQGRYAGRFADVAPDWIRSAAVYDAQWWTGQALATAQLLEATIVAYLALVHRLDTKRAGALASRILEAPEAKKFAAFWRHLRTSSHAGVEFESRLKEVLNERNWVVHKSFHDFALESVDDTKRLIERLRHIFTESATLNSELHALLLERCAAAGMARTEAERRAGEVVREWAAA
ncbi:MAG: hypothetical protein HY561_06530 [Gemmatimonadetes bacterium]|nr:hypothetical protein [Gemmatimonadota bacterium]